MKGPKRHKTGDRETNNKPLLKSRRKLMSSKSYLSVYEFFKCDLGFWARVTGAGDGACTRFSVSRRKGGQIPQ